MARLQNVESRRYCGEKPRGDVVFVACGASDFIEHGLPLAFSLDQAQRETEAMLPLHAHVINPTDAEVARLALLDRLIATPFTFTIEFTELAGFSSADLAGYAACSRFVTATHFFHDDLRVLLVDVRLLFQQPPRRVDEPVAFLPTSAGDARADALWIAREGLPFLERVRDICGEHELSTDLPVHAVKKALREQRAKAAHWRQWEDDFLGDSEDAVIARPAGDGPQAARRFHQRQNAYRQMVDWSGVS